VDIKLLHARSPCLVDANIFIYYLAGSSPDCKSFLQRIANGEIVGYLTTVIIAEVLHRRMIGEAVAKGLVTPNKPLNSLKANPALIQKLAEHSLEIQKLLSLPLGVIQVEQNDITRSHTLRRTHGLFVNDSINLACAERMGLTNVVTNDSDFGRVPGIDLWKPTDV
jgi:predicted nucleic acid-binding protein